jgi:hypothetical protein
MTKLNRTSRRAAICRVEQLDERIALSGMTAAAVHSGPVPFPVSPIPPFFLTHTGSVSDDAPITTVRVVPHTAQTPGTIVSGHFVATGTIQTFTTQTVPGPNPFLVLYPSPKGGMAFLN